MYFKKVLYGVQKGWHMIPLKPTRMLNILWRGGEYI
jgi:hypothetical protein